ncbi:MAG: restriction endonuclease [Clostridia bacterium]|nr:restriction endonuclease [Clostridia bacterium]
MIKDFENKKYKIQDKNSKNRISSVLKSFIFIAVISWIIFLIFGFVAAFTNEVAMVIVGTFIGLGGLFIFLLGIIVEQSISKKKSKKIDIGNIANGTSKTKEEMTKDRVYEIIDNLKKGIFEIEYPKLGDPLLVVGNQMSLDERLEFRRKFSDKFAGKSKEEYDTNVKLFVSHLKNYYTLFEKYLDNKEITKIIQNFILDNPSIVNKGSFNQFFLDYELFDCDVDNIKGIPYYLYTNYYYYDKPKFMHNAINQYILEYADIKTIDTKENFDLLYENVLKHEEIKLSFTFKENLSKKQKEFIDLINSAYKAMTNDKIYIQESLCDKFRKTFEYSDDLPIDIYSLAVHLCITNFDKYDFDWETNEYNSLYKPVKEVYDTLQREYKNAFLLKTGLLKKYNDLNYSVIFMLMQYHLNQFKLNKAKKMVNNFDKIHYDSSGLLFDDSDECNKMLQYLYDEEYTIEDIIKLDKLLNNQTAGEELVGLVQVDVNFNVVDERDKYKFVIDKFNEFLSEEYVNKLSTKEVIKNKKITIDDIDRMNGIEFENFIADLFEKMGYSTKVTKASNDQGVDIIATRGERIVAIQAKCYSQPVGNHAIMEVCGGAKYYNATECMVITNQVFTKSAIELADANSVELWDRRVLIEKLMR